MDREPRKYRADELVSQIHKYYTLKAQGKLGDLRLGQWWLNEYNPSTVDSTLFYERDSAEAELLINNYTREKG